MRRQVLKSSEAQARGIFLKFSVFGADQVRTWTEQTSSDKTTSTNPNNNGANQREKERPPDKGGSQRSPRQADHLVTGGGRKPADAAITEDITVEHDLSYLNQSSEHTVCGGDGTANAGDLNGGNPSDLAAVLWRKFFRRAASFQQRA